MKKFIYVLALISAFFVFAEPDMSDLRSPKTDSQAVLKCVSLSGQDVLSFTAPAGSTGENAIPYCSAYLMNEVAEPREGLCPPAEPRLEVSSTMVRLRQSRYKPWYWDDGSFGGCSNAPANNTVLYGQTGDPIEVQTCPPENAPEHTIPVTVEGQKMCARDKDDIPEDHCPEPTGQEVYVSGIHRAKVDICYQNKDGSQCRITTDNTGGYYFPLEFGNQEPTYCADIPREPVEEPEKTPEPDKPDDSPDPTPTQDPTPKEERDEVDNTTSANELDGINQINNNLKTINSNMNKNSDSNDNRLDALLAETKNTNELLSSVKQNTSATTNNTGKTLEEVGKSNEQLYGLNQLSEEMNGKLGDGEGTGDGTGDGNGDGDGNPDCVGDGCNLDDEILDELKKLNNANAGTGLNKEAAQSFWESEYEEGLSGIWNEKKGDFQNTEAFQFIEQFKFNAGGTAPNSRICFNLGSNMNYGCQDLPLPDAALLAIIKIFILITAAFLCRALVFGG